MGARLTVSCAAQAAVHWYVAGRLPRDTVADQALGRALAFEAFVKAVNIRGRVCIMHNDTSAAIADFPKGSLQSPEMQRCAVYLSRVAAANDVDF